MVALTDLRNPLDGSKPMLLDQGGESHVGRSPIGLLQLLLICKPLTKVDLHQVGVPTPRARRVFRIMINELQFLEKVVQTSYIGQASMLLKPLPIQPTVPRLDTLTPRATHIVLLDCFITHNSITRSSHRIHLNALRLNRWSNNLPRTGKDL